MIFNLFKSKPTLKELIPNGFVDIHSHILPGIDDGAKNVDESIKLISSMNKIGFKKIIGTPHTITGLYDNTNKSISDSYNKLKSFDIEVEINYSSEYMIEPYLFEKIEEKTIIPLKENYVLIEMSYIDKPTFLYDIIFGFKINGYIPVLAHPERYGFLFSDFQNFLKLKRRGCKFQINLLSLTGYYGKKVTSVCQKLINKNLVDFVGSDIHNMHHVDEFEKKIIINNKPEIGNILKRTNDIFI